MKLTVPLTCLSLLAVAGTGCQSGGPQHSELKTGAGPTVGPNFPPDLDMSFKASAKDLGQLADASIEASLKRQSRSFAVSLDQLNVDVQNAWTTIRDKYMFGRGLPGNSDEDKRRLDQGFDDSAKAVLALSEKVRAVGSAAREASKTPPAALPSAVDTVGTKLREAISQARDAGLSTLSPASVPVGASQQQSGSGNQTSINTEGNVQSAQNVSGHVVQIQGDGNSVRLEEQDGVKQLIDDALRNREHSRAFWKVEPDGAQTLITPLVAHGETRITGNIDPTPFLKSDREIRIEVARLSNTEDRALFRYMVKADVPGLTPGNITGQDPNRMAAAGGDGEIALVQQVQPGDRAFYLAWRGTDVSRDAFLHRNPNAVVVMRTVREAVTSAASMDAP